jgi:hypothetical protein
LTVNDETISVEPDELVERIVHDPVPPAPGAEDQKPKPRADDDTAEPAAQTTEQQEAHKQSKFQRRLDRQKVARVAAETEARMLREQRDELRARLEGQARPQQDAGSTGAPTREQYADYEEYLRACARYDAAEVTDKRLRAEREERQARERQQQNDYQLRAEHEKLSKGWIERENAFKASAKDYDEKVNAYLDESIGELSTDARSLIIESELGPQLLHHLSVNPDEAERIAELSPRRQLIELGKLEDRLPKLGSRKTTNAPPPASTVRQGANSADGLRENMTQKEVAAYMKSHGSRWVR